MHATGLSTSLRQKNLHFALHEALDSLGFSYDLAWGGHLHFVFFNGHPDAPPLMMVSTQGLGCLVGTPEGIEQQEKQCIQQLIAVPQK